MNNIRRYCTVVAASLQLACWFISPSRAQSDETPELRKRVLELYQAGKYREAIPLAQRALSIDEREHGPNHPAVAADLNDLAALYKSEGRYADAEPLYRQALAIQEKALGPDQSDVANTLNNLARLYDSENRSVDAEALYKRALAIWEKVLGPNHPDAATALSNLAQLYQSEGRYAEAEPRYKRALAIEEKGLGPDHPYVAESLNNLASLYEDEGRYADAEPLYKRSLEIYEKSLGTDHTYVAAVLIGLAGLYEDEGSYAAAEPLYKRALAIWENALGPNHPTVATALNNLADLYRDEGRYADAEPLLKRALVIREKALGANHPDVAQALNNIAVLYHIEGRYRDAEPLSKRALGIDRKALGPDHPHMASDLNNLAMLYQDAGRYADAESLFERSLAIRQKALGPDHPAVATTLNNLAALFGKEGRYLDAEPLFKRALAIREKAFGLDHPDVAQSLNNLAALYNDQKRYADALPFVRSAIAHKRAASWPALPVLFATQAARLMPASEAFDDSLNVLQRAQQSAAGAALNALAARFAAGNDRLAALVRKDQDLAGETAALDKAIIASVSKEPSKRDAAAEQKIRDRIAAIGQERDDLAKTFARNFPDYAALSKPEPLTVKDIQPLLADDEALVIIDLDAKTSYIWAITHSAEEWKELVVTAGEVSKQVSSLRALLDIRRAKPFAAQASFALYQKLLAPVEDLVEAKPRLSFVLNGALTSLPPQVLVTRDPAGKALNDVDWLIRSHAVTVLPSVVSLKVLRSKSVLADAAKPLIGFANPVFAPDPQRLARNTTVIADVSATRGIRGMVADIAQLKKELQPLPETADELRKVAESVHADLHDLFLGAEATETRVKREKLDQYRIVYFATHGLLAGDVAEFAKLNAEPALVLSLPEHPTEFDDGLLTASEAAQLKLNADWVVLSACNTAAADKPGAEALSGLARAFFYAGARSLIVSNWEVDTDSAVAVMTGTFAALAANPKLSHGEALQKSMLAMIDDPKHSRWADPKYWAPFVVVGEPAKPAN